MNTDNMLLSGETIDYGPCAFMNAYDPETVYSSIDRYGRYAYGNQPTIAQWNLSRLAEAVLLIGDASEERISRAQAAVDSFPEKFRAAYGIGMGRKLGLTEVDDEAWTLIEDLLGLMHENEADYTLTFRRLANLLADDAEDLEPLSEAFDAWVDRWRTLVGRGDRPLADVAASMRRASPVVIPRNHRVEQAIDAAVDDGNLTPFHDLADSLVKPWDWPEDARYVQPPAPHEEIKATFCGT
jgi:uncharacterized protein YdiU (UPF0061 family)